MYTVQKARYRMVKIIGVRFKPAGKIYDFDPGAFVPGPGDGVIVETEQGLAYGTVATDARMAEDPPAERPYKKIYRLATAKDLSQVEQNAADERAAHAFCRKCIKELKLEMNLLRSRSPSTAPSTRSFSPPRHGWISASWSRCW